MKVVVLLSGGLDSVTALHDALQQQEVVAALSFDYGAKHHARELPMAAWQCGLLSIPHSVAPLGIVAKEFESDLLSSGGAIPDGHYEEKSMKSTVVPFRNGIMLAIAAGWAVSLKFPSIAFGAHAGTYTPYPDCQPPFVAAMNCATQLCDLQPITVLAPFVDWHKADIVRRGQALGVPFELTWSCYQGASLHCGKCSTCLDRRIAFAECGLIDPVPYQS